MADSKKKDQAYDAYYNYLKQGYQESDASKQAQKDLAGLKAPESYTSQYSDQIKNYTNQYLNSKFDYDHNNDPAFQRYKQQYTQNAQKAMQDTVGQVSVLTGGYGNSYAQTAGQESYNGYMDKLNDAITGLEDRAYGRYQDKNNQLYNGIGLMQNLENTDYSRYRDTLSDYYTNREYYNNRYNNERNFDYGKYTDLLNSYMNNAQFQNTDYWNTVGQENTDRDYTFQQQQLDYQKQQNKIANQLAQDQFNYSKEQDAATNYYNLLKLQSDSTKKAQDTQEKQLKSYISQIDAYKKNQDPTDKSLAKYIDSLDLDDDTKETILKRYGLTTVWLNLHWQTDPNPDAKNKFNWPD